MLLAAQRLRDGPAPAGGKLEDGLVILDFGSHPGPVDALVQVYRPFRRSRAEARNDKKAR